MKDFFVGIGFVGRGCGLLLKTPRLWGLTIAPLLGAVLAYILLGALCGFWLVPRIEALLGEWALLGKFGALVLWLLLFPPLFLALVGAGTGIVFEPLAREVEAIATGKSPAVIPLTTPQTLGDSLCRLLLNLTLSSLAFVLGLFLGPIPGVIAAAIIGVLDYTSVVYLRQGMRLKEQRRDFRAHFRTHLLGFGLVAGLLALVPFVGIFFYPALIAGGTLLGVHRSQTGYNTPHE